MSWKRLDMSTDAVARGAGDTLRASFEAAFTGAGSPRKAALFALKASDGVQFFFSPGAAELFEPFLKTMPQKSAGAPGPDAKLIVGDPATWSCG